MPNIDLALLQMVRDTPGVGLSEMAQARQRTLSAVNKRMRLMQRKRLVEARRFHIADKARYFLTSHGLQKLACGQP